MKNMMLMVAILVCGISAQAEPVKTLMSPAVLIKYKQALKVYLKEHHFPCDTFGPDARLQVSNFKFYRFTIMEISQTGYIIEDELGRVYELIWNKGGGRKMVSRFKISLDNNDIVSITVDNVEEKLVEKGNLKDTKVVSIDVILARHVCQNTPMEQPKL